MSGRAFLESTALKVAAQRFYKIHDRFPTEQEGLAILFREKLVDRQLALNAKGEPLDPWKRPYIYKLDGIPEVYSLGGPEGSPGYGVAYGGLGLLVLLASLLIILWRLQLRRRFVGEVGMEGRKKGD